MNKKLFVYLIASLTLISFSITIISSGKIELESNQNSDSGLPDLIISNLTIRVPDRYYSWWSPDLPEYDSATFTVKMRNIGEDTTIYSTIKIQLYLDHTTLLGTFDYPHVTNNNGVKEWTWRNNQNRSKVIYVEDCWPVDNKTHNVTVKIDTTNIVTESDENNGLTESFKQNIIKKSKERYEILKFQKLFRFINFLKNFL